jgi:glycosyltransferase involved in cell wall biosynthesis
MVASLPASVRPDLSVVVPARNEEASLAACLDSLHSQSGLSFEIIVVDDGSTDRTRAIAASYPRVEVISPGPLLPGVVGKNNALIAGSAHARGEWLLFTDADTVHRPESLLRSLSEARMRGVDLLSYSPEQEVHNFAERAVMPVIFSELAALYPPLEVSDPNSPLAAANGQFLLISRRAYDAIGGHAAIAGEILEDVCMAQRMKQSGRKIFFRYGADMVRTRMYRSYRDLRDGWTKNLALLFPHTLRLALARVQECFVLVAGSAFAVWAAMMRHVDLAAVSALLSLALAALLIRRTARAHFGWKSNALFLFGLLLFSYLLVRSKLFHKLGRVRWKGREYATGSHASEPRRSTRVKPVS